MGIEDPCLEPNAGGWVEDAGKAVGEDRPLGRSPGAWPVRAQCMQAKPFTAGPVTPTAAAAWPASGLGSRPGRSLSCTGSSSGPSPPASRRGRGGAEEEHAVTLHHSRNSNQTGGGGPARAPRPHARPLSYSQPPGQDGRCSPPTAARLLPRMLASPSTNLRAKGQRPRAPCVCAPQRQLERRGRPAPWASSRHCGPSWAGNTRIDPGGRRRPRQLRPLATGETGQLRPHAPRETPVPRKPASRPQSLQIPSAPTDSGHRATQPTPAAAQGEAEGTRGCLRPSTMPQVAPPATTAWLSAKMHPPSTPHTHVLQPRDPKEAAEAGSFLEDKLQCRGVDEPQAGSATPQVQSSASPAPATAAPQVKGRAASPHDAPSPQPPSLEQQGQRSPTP